MAVDQSPLKEREWTLQERLLSMRSVHVTDKGLFWNCPSSTASECHPEVVSEERTRLYEEAYWTSLQNYYRWNLGNDQKSPSAIWFDICEQYSVRQLTNNADKLSAISGIASRFHDKFYPNVQYLAGVWSSDLPEALAWRRSPSPEAPDGRSRERVKGLPTWSWASIRHQIRYHSNLARPALESHVPVLVGQERQEASSTPIAEPFRVQFLQPDIVEANINPFGDVCGGMLTLRGKFKQLRLEVLKRGADDDPSCHLITIEGTNHTGEVCFGDPDKGTRIIKAAATEIRVPAMMLCHDIDQDRYVVLLERTGTSNSPEFRRIGLYIRWNFAADDTSFDQGWEETEIIVI